MRMQINNKQIAWNTEKHKECFSFVSLQLREGHNFFVQTTEQSKVKQVLS